MNTVTADPEVASEVVDAACTSPIVEYNATAAALAELRQRLTGKTYDLRTVAGDKAARADRLELTRLISALEDRRVELKAPVLERGRLLDAEAKRITAELEALREPIAKQIKADETRREEERKAREAAEAQRIATLQTRIDALRAVPVRAAGKPSADIESRIFAVEGLPIGEDFAELLGVAQQVRIDVLEQLREMLAAVKAQEAAAERVRAERAAMERQRHFDAKLQELRSLSVGMAGKSAADLAEAIVMMDRLDMSLETWGEAAVQAKALGARAAVLAELRTMQAAAEERERVAAEQAQQARDLTMREAISVIDRLEMRCQTKTAKEIGGIVGGLEIDAKHPHQSEAPQVNEARRAAIMRLRALRDIVAAREAQAAAQDTERQEAQQVLKAEPATADATDRAIPATTSPRVGAMGVGQPADAGPADVQPPVQGAQEPEAATPGADSAAIPSSEPVRFPAPTPQPEEPATLNLGAICARFGEGLTMTRAYIEQVLKVPATGTSSRGVALWSEAGFKGTAAALRDVADRLAGAA